MRRNCYKARPRLLVIEMPLLTLIASESWVFFGSILYPGTSLRTLCIWQQNMCCVLITVTHKAI